MTRRGENDSLLSRLHRTHGKKFNKGITQQLRANPEAAGNQLAFGSPNDGLSDAMLKTHAELQVNSVVLQLPFVWDFKFQGPIWILGVCVSITGVRLCGFDC